ncbi:MAG: hypothetical protein WC262_10800 [Bacteroidales bacterium]|jgi:hypothetical protein
MKVSITEDYPGEMREKADELMARVAKACGAESACACGGNCGHVEKAVAGNKRQPAGAVKPDGDETPFQFIKDIRKRAHDLGAHTQDNIIAGVVRYLEQTQQ